MLVRTVELVKLLKSNHPGFFVMTPAYRDKNEHMRRCERLQSSLTDKAKKYWSRVYGINKRSVLLDVTGFDVTVGLIYDLICFLRA